MAISPNPNSSLKKSAACFASDKQSCKILFVSREVSPPFRFLGKKVVGASQTHDLVIKPSLFVPSPLAFSSVQSDPWLDELDKSIPNSKFNYSNFFDPNPALTFSFGNK